MANSLPPVPLQDIKDFPYVLQEWLRQIRNVVQGANGSIPWASVSKTGSNLNELVTRNHYDLQNLQGGTTNEYYHLTSAQWDHAHTLNVRTTKSIAGGVNVTLTSTEAQARSIEFTGVITANISVIVPTAFWVWNIYNNTTGAFTVTVKTNAGTGIVVTQTKRCILECDGTNVVRITADV